MTEKKGEVPSLVNLPLRVVDASCFIGLTSEQREHAGLPSIAETLAGNGIPPSLEFLINGDYPEIQNIPTHLHDVHETWSGISISNSQEGHYQQLLEMELNKYLSNGEVIPPQLAFWVVYRKRTEPIKSEHSQESRPITTDEQVHQITEIATNSEIIIQEFIQWCSINMLKTKKMLDLDITNKRERSNLASLANTIINYEYAFSQKMGDESQFPTARRNADMALAQLKDLGRAEGVI